MLGLHLQLNLAMLTIVFIYRGIFMRHEWIFDVLTDLRKYAEKNGLTDIAGETARMMDVVRSELAEKTRAEQMMVDEKRVASFQIEPHIGHKNTK